ncbi:uncharacterized protein LOC128237635 [Mya arenaria]|uniref:uncharacterized protein LOC128237635 n=1 Tax=Mya arenaria TaxID=6604 RepID=UPI0022E290B6|nr:uncharacterized protein LOC128237635 [Mya arenaria]
MGQLSDSEKFLLDFIYVLDEFGVPSLLTIGVVSNLILAITVRNSELKKIAPCCYFYALGIVDTLYLIVMAIPWFSLRLLDIYNMEGFCQVIYYLNLLTTFLSSWFVVMLLIERIIMCYRPNIAEKYFNAFRTKCYITAVSIFAIVGHLYLTWTSGVFYNQIFNRKLCMVIPENSQDIVTMRKIDTVFSFILPLVFCILLILPLSIYICASKLKCVDGILRVRTKVVTVEVRLNTRSQRRRYTECPSCSNMSNISNYEKVQRQRILFFSQSKRLSLTATVVAVIFVVLSIPHNVIKAKIVFLNGDYIITYADQTFLKLFEELYKINFAFKALIYFSLLPEMRKSLVKLVLSCWRRSSKSNKVELKDRCVVTTL